MSNTLSHREAPTNPLSLTHTNTHLPTHKYTYIYMCKILKYIIIFNLKKNMLICAYFVMLQYILFNLFIYISLPVSVRTYLTIFNEFLYLSFFLNIFNRKQRMIAWKPFPTSGGYSMNLLNNCCVCVSYNYYACQICMSDLISGIDFWDSFRSNINKHL